MVASILSILLDDSLWDFVPDVYKRQIKEFPKLQMACLRDVIPSYEREGILWKRMKKAADKICLLYISRCV